MLALRFDDPAPRLVLKAPVRKHSVMMSPMLSSDRRIQTLAKYYTRVFSSNTIWDRDCVTQCQIQPKLALHKFAPSHVCFRLHPMLNI